MVWRLACTKCSKPQGVAVSFQITSTTDISAWFDVIHFTVLSSWHSVHFVNAPRCARRHRHCWVSPIIEDVFSSFWMSYSLWLGFDWPTLVSDTDNDIPLRIKDMLSHNSVWIDRKFGEVMWLLEHNAVVHDNPNDLKHLIQGFFKRERQTVGLSHERIDEGVIRKSWGSVMQLCDQFSKDEVHLQLSKDDLRWECLPLHFSCVSGKCDLHKY